ncbi:murein biosynthesis integral membrane protein MurJ [Catenovulum sp. 2E275]|uniref:murein biosynthesis integral membrane protein MurJ n=1 Tax=Catenovulum sp. 2E275 TaxID=2980497 RepID=UPI0021D3DF5A|nr:murein biosynthesis integral membrane protein MurJ [Catenovulum sp. 2E275]MCU4676288.1 murein biosynthesis integral membrane protein MurJ [Catenovulum sp. 2E275]
MSKSLLRSGMLFSVMTFISRVLGLVRDVVIANLLGASAAADVFILTNKIPNFLRRLFAEGAFAQAFVPVLTEYKENKSVDETHLLIARVSGTLGCILLITTLIGVIASPVVIMLFGTGWFIDWLQGNPEGVKYELASVMLKITFPYLFFVALTAFSGAVLNTWGKFGVAAFTPVLLNIAMIIAAIFFADQFIEPAFALAWGVFFGGILQLLFQLPFLKQAGLIRWPKWGWNDPGVKKIRLLMLPALFGVSVSQINLLFDTVLASFLQSGSISWLYYSDRLLEFPLGLFGIAIATVILPQLSKDHVKSTEGGFEQTMDWGIRMVCLLGIPSALGLMALAEPMLMALFMRGEFTAMDAAQSKLSLMAYSSGLLFFMLIKVLATGFFARQDTKTPVKIGIRAMLANMVFNLILIFPLAHAGLALATSLSALFNAAFLYVYLKREGVYCISPTTFKFVMKVCLAGLAMLALLILAQPSSVEWAQMTLELKIGYLTGLIAAGGVCYLLGLFILRVKLSDIRSA